MCTSDSRWCLLDLFASQGFVPKQLTGCERLTSHTSHKLGLYECYKPTILTVKDDDIAGTSNRAGREARAGFDCEACDFRLVEVGGVGRLERVQARAEGLGSRDGEDLGGIDRGAVLRVAVAGAPPAHWTSVCSHLR